MTAKLRGKEEYPFYFGAKPEVLRLAGELRHGMTKAEKILWGRLRGDGINGFRFRRQHPIYEFIVDFFCYEAMLVIELDGEVHNNSYQKERDIERTRILNRFGINVIRFKNNEVESDLEGVMTKIRMIIESH